VNKQNKKKKKKKEWQKSHHSHTHKTHVHIQKITPTHHKGLSSVDLALKIFKAQKRVG
jgi:hypothetical protein